MKERPILIVVIGYIIGILWGLYFKISIALLYIFIATIYYLSKIFRKKKIAKFNILSIKRYFRYIKILFNKISIYLIILSSVISNIIINFQNQKYDKLYVNEEKLNLIAIVVSNKEEKEYKDTYKIKVISEKYKNSYLILNINKKTQLEYGDKILIKAEFIKPMEQRNYNGFDYSSYLKSLKIYGTINAENVSLISKNSYNLIYTISNNINLKIKENINKLMKEEYATIFIGLILGDTSNIEEKIKEDFKIANMSHILAISGMHITYLIIGIEMLFKKLIGKRKTKILIIFILILYMFITNFSPSVVRASIMAIIMLLSKILYRKNDIWTSISLSLLILLVYNPFLITNIGLQLSYLGTIGIILFNKNVYKILEKIEIKNVKIKYKINKRILLLFEKVREILSITLSAQIMILPIMLFHFNILGIYFFISNILVSFIIGPIIIIGFVCILISFISVEIAKLLSKILFIGIKLLIYISQISLFPFSKIYVRTPKICEIIVYIIFIIIANKIYTVFNSKNLNYTNIRIRNTIALFKYKIKQNKKKFSNFIIIFIISIFILNIIPKNLKIHFIDVGQGDSTFIVTPMNKTILIDGGGSLSSKFDVGKSTLLPYILDRGYTKIDYIFISHFDQDHVGGILTILEELQVGQVYISKQEENSENYQKFLDIVKDKDISVKILKQGDIVKIEKDVYFNILWPIKEQIKENVLNNNAMVMKLRYKEFSMLFTGDIEEIAEKKILEFFNNKNVLKSDVLKVAHHGSNTSTTKEFLENVNPNICLIGVGINNLFNHPSNQVIKRIEGRKIYRTDENGEIILNVNRKGKNKLRLKIVAHL